MDVDIIPIGSRAWRIQDELGRHLGDIERVATSALVIKPGSLLSDLHHGPFLSLALAMAEIARGTHGTCTLAE